MTATSPPRLLRLPAVLERTGLGRDSVFRYIKANRFPKQHKIGTRASAWLEADITRWIEERTSGKGAS